MKKTSFGSLPTFNTEKSLLTLSTPYRDIKNPGDYYKAVFSLSIRPNAIVKEELLKFLKLDSNQLEIRIAQRKAIETLSEFGAPIPIDLVYRFLESVDPLLVESMVLAIHKLRYNDANLIKKLSLLLNDKKQNRRTIVKVIASLGLVNEAPKIRSILNENDQSNGLRCACIAAICSLTGEVDHMFEIDRSLLSTNQNERHCAVQDVIDSGSIDLMPTLLKSPISPGFKIRAIESLWAKNNKKMSNNNIFKLLEYIIIDDADKIEVGKPCDVKIDTGLLVEELFNPDFSRAYSAVRSLRRIDNEDLVSLLNLSWERAMKDYGALYFFVNLYRDMLSNGFHIDRISEKILYLLGPKWPDKMKFKAPAIASLIYLRGVLTDEILCDLLDEDCTPFWFNRYTCLYLLEHLDGPIRYKELLAKAQNDSNFIVREKADCLLSL